MAITIRDSVNLEQLLTPITYDILTKWKTDGTILFAPDTRVVDASFALPPNTEFTCSNYGLDTSKDSTIHKKIFIAYPTEYKVGERIKLLLTPGDSIIQDKEAFTNAHTYRYEGRGSEQNNLQYNTQRFSYYNSEYGNISPDELKKSFQHRDSLFQTTLEKILRKWILIGREYLNYRNSISKEDLSYGATCLRATKKPGMIAVYSIGKLLLSHQSIRLLIMPTT